MIKKYVLQLLICVFAGSGIAPASAASRQCVFNGYLVDKDPNGTNVRAAPNLHSKVVGKMSNAAHGFELSAEFEVLEVKNGWILIHNYDPEPDEPWTKTGFRNYVGKGWVAAPLLRVDPYSSVFRASASETSKILFDIDPKKTTSRDGLFGLLKQQVLVGCDGQWAKIKTEHGTGWINRVCGNPKTTCS